MEVVKLGAAVRTHFEKMFRYTWDANTAGGSMNSDTFDPAVIAIAGLSYILNLTTVKKLVAPSKAALIYSFWDKSHFAWRYS